MFSKTAIFAISALAYNANGQLTQSYPGCSTNIPAFPACPTGYVQTEACECCPEENKECDATYLGQFCSGTGTTAKLDAYRLPLSCPQRQAVQTCTAKCSFGTGVDASSKFQIRQDTCECCPAPGLENNAFFGGKYYDSVKKELILTEFAKSCPQKQKITATCTKTCAAPEALYDLSCECCPETTKKCTDTATDAATTAFKTKYCNSDKSFNFAQVPPSCPQNFDPSLRTTPTTCPQEFCLDGFFRAPFSCDCCPYVGTECKLGFCDANGVLDKTKLPASCTASQELPVLCKNTFCPPSYIVGQNCECCPIKGQECTAQYGGQFCDSTNKILLSNIPEGCPSKDSFNTCTTIDATGKSVPLTCEQNFFKTLACDCCPYEGKECDTIYNGAFCTNNKVDLTKIGKSCPQQTQQKDCSKILCPAGFIQSSDCSCCPEPGFECDSKYNNQFCDAAGILLKQNIPLSCPQQKKQIQACTPELYLKLKALVGTSLNKYVNSQCDICPVQGKECETDTVDDFCVVIRQSKSADLSRIPATCPQAQQLTQCDVTLYTKNAQGQCCPLKGKETNAAYNGRFATPDGQLIYNNIPAGCPQFEQKSGCLQCVEGTFMPTEATNCECCPYPGFECDPRYGGKYCDLNGNLIVSAVPAVCRSKPVCDDRYYWTGSDDFTCCPFQGKECDPVYSNQYCPIDLKATPPKLGNVLDKSTIRPECQAPPKGAQTCSHVYNAVNGTCCPLKGFECSVLYQFEQFCTKDQIDYSKIDYRCPQFEDICQANEFRKQNVKNSQNQDVFGSCCPLFANNNSSGIPTSAEACTAAYGYTQGVSGGLFCDKAGAIRDDVKAACTVPAAAGPASTCTPFEYEITGAKCCPKAGFECVGPNVKYCSNGLPDDSLIDAGCSNTVAKLAAAGACGAAATAHKFWVQISGSNCVQCPIIGSECDGTKYAYTSDKSEYCDRVVDNTNGDKFTLNIMSIPPQCPQRAGLNSLAPATHFSIQQNVFCPDPLIGLTFGAFYSTWAPSQFTFNVNLIPACKNLGSVTCPACGAKEVAVKTGNASPNECICCPVDPNNLRDPVYNNKYYNNGAPVAGALNEQCKLPVPTNTGVDFKCPKAVACGTGWIASTTTCECCPDLTKYTDTWCAAEKTPSELSNLLCESINAAGAKKRATLDASKIPSACTAADITNFPKLSLIDYRERDGSSCPLPGTECDTTRTSPQYCTAPVFDVKTGSIQKLDIAKFAPSCPQVKETSVCATNACQQNYITTVDPLNPTDASQCQCCPILNKECSEVYNGQFCKDGKILYENIPSGCPQFDRSQSCNLDFFDKTSTGSCCPKEGTDCIPQFNHFFCNFDGSFNKQNYDNAKCSVPACKSTCSGYYISNGCDCCPFPGFELDEVYNGAYRGFDGSVNVPKECQTLNLFPVNAWQTISKFTPADFGQAKTVNGLPPVGTQALGEAVYGSVENFYNQKGKPLATIKELEAIGVNPKINWISKGAVFGIEAVNKLYTILSTPRDQVDKTLPTPLQAAIDAQITAMAASGYVEYPATIFQSLGVKDKAEFAALSLVEKRYRLVTFWFMKPFTAGSKFGQQDRFLLGETNWISAAATISAGDLTAEYILSQTVSALNDPRNQLINAKNILATTAKLADSSIDKFLKLDRVRQTYEIVKNTIQTQNPTIDSAWHLAKAPKTTTNAVNTLDKLIQYSVYWFDQKYPGLQAAETAIAGETPAENAARVAVYEAFIAECIKAGIKADSVEDTFPQYRMEQLIQAEIQKYQSTNLLWDFTRPPVKYTTATVQLYANGFQSVLTNGMINDVIDSAREMESWPTKYKDALPAGATIASLWADNVLGGILTELGIVSTNIKASPTGNEISEKNALFKVAWQLYTTGRNPQDVFIPTYPQTVLDTYGLKADVISIYNLSPQQVAIVYQNALDAETDLTNNEAKRTADLNLAFDGNPSAVTAATKQQKAGKLSLFFYLLATKPKTAQANVGVIKPKPYSRYFDSPTAAEKTERDALFITNADLQNGKYNSFSVATAIQTKVVQADLALGSPTYPTKFAEAVKDAAYTGGDNAAKAAYLAYYIATAELGLRARGKPAIEAYFPGTRIENIVKAKIDESDLKAIDDRVIAEVNFRYSADTLKQFGLTGTPTKAQVAQVVFADELAQKKINYYDQLYNNSTLVQHLKTLGVTDDELYEINLSFDQVNADPAQWNSEAIGNMLFTTRYGLICDLNAVCTTGWASNKALAEIVFPLGLSRKTALAKGYSLLEVLQLARNYRNWSNNDARLTNDLGKLYGADALGAEAVKNLYFDGAVKTADELITLGTICKPAGYAGASTEPVVSGTIKVCDYYTNNAYPQFLAKSRADTLFAPRTNIDVLFDSFGKALNQAKFNAVLDASTKIITAGASTHADYSFEKFLAAVAQFPFFCNVDENKQDTTACEKQVIGLLTVVGANTNGFKDSVIAAPSCNGAAFDNTCQNWPDVETVEYHWIMKLVKNAGIAVADAVYPAWGAGALKGPVAYLDFFHTYPNTSAQKPVFESPKLVAELLTAQPELNWATALYRWFQPNKVNTVEQVTEAADTNPANAKKYFFVEDSYLTPSFDMWMLGNIGPENVLSVMFPTNYGGLRGILKNLYGADCHSTVTVTGKPIDNALKIYAEIVKIYASAPSWTNVNKDCSAVAGATAAAQIGRWDQFNRKNYFSPAVTTVQPDTFAVKNFQGSAGQCFNVHIETPFSIFGKDSYARCVALKLKSTFGTTPVKQAATNFVGETGFTFQF